MMIVCAACKREYLEVGEAKVHEAAKGTPEKELVSICEDCARKYDQWRRSQIKH